MSAFPNELIQGYKSFQTGRLKQDQSVYETLATEGQQPHTMLISCCDSRAAPELVFDAGPGEIFVVRNVANLVPAYSPDGRYDATAAALEYAVTALKVKNVVVMGHALCGGIAAALDQNFSALSEDNFVGTWIASVGPAAQSVLADDTLSSEDRQRSLERLSVSRSVENLKSYPCLKTALDKGDVTVAGAWFDIFSGALWTMDTSGNFAAV